MSKQAQAQHSKIELQIPEATVSPRCCLSFGLSHTRATTRLNRCKLRAQHAAAAAQMSQLRRQSIASSASASALTAAAATATATALEFLTSVTRARFVEVEEAAAAARRAFDLSFAFWEQDSRGLLGAR